MALSPTAMPAAKALGDAIEGLTPGFYVMEFRRSFTVLNRVEVVLSTRGRPGTTRRMLDRYMLDMAERERVDTREAAAASAVARAEEALQVATAAHESACGETQEAAVALRAAQATEQAAQAALQEAEAALARVAV